MCDTNYVRIADVIKETWEFIKLVFHFLLHGKKLKKPKISVTGLSNVKMIENRLSLDVGFAIDNQNMVSATVKGVSLSLYLNDSYVGDGIIDHAVVIAKNSVTEEKIKVEISASKSSLLSLLASTMGVVNYEVRGKISIAGFPFPYFFKEQGKYNGWKDLGSAISGTSWDGVKTGIKEFFQKK